MITESGRRGISYGQMMPKLVMKQLSFQQMIAICIEMGCLDEEMQTIAEETQHLDDLGELNDIMEEEIGYFGMEEQEGER